MKLYRFHDIAAPNASRYPIALPEKKTFEIRSDYKPHAYNAYNKPCNYTDRQFSFEKYPLIDIIGTNESIIVISATGIYSIAVYSQK